MTPSQAAMTKVKALSNRLEECWASISPNSQDMDTLVTLLTIADEYRTALEEVAQERDELREANDRLLREWGRFRIELRTELDRAGLRSNPGVSDDDIRQMVGILGEDRTELRAEVERLKANSKQTQEGVACQFRARLARYQALERAVRDAAMSYLLDTKLHEAIAALDEKDG